MEDDKNTLIKRLKKCSLGKLEEVARNTPHLIIENLEEIFSQNWADIFFIMPVLKGISPDTDARINEILQNKVDYDAIYNLVKKAFETAKHSDGNEQDLVNALRKGKSYINELSLVAEFEEKIKGIVHYAKEFGI